MKKVFSWKTFVAQELNDAECFGIHSITVFIENLKASESWVMRCDGKTVEECEAMGYLIDDAWTIEVED